MIKSLFPILISLFIGWTLHILYTQNNTKKISMLQVNKVDCSNYEKTVLLKLLKK